MYYTGIGSRNTPERVVRQMRQLAMHLAFTGYTLRSGKAKGADQAFQEGLEVVERSTPFGCTAEIYIPWEGFNSDVNSKWDRVLGEIGNEDKAEKIASETHPAWDRCSQGARKLHTRNVYQVLGEELKDPSEFVICYAEPTKTGVKGGTNMAVQIAKGNGVPVFNLWYEEEFLNAIEFVRMG